MIINPQQGGQPVYLTGRAPMTLLTCELCHARTSRLVSCACLLLMCEPCYQHHRDVLVGQGQDGPVKP